MVQNSMNSIKTKALIIAPKREVYFKEIKIEQKDLSEVEMNWEISSVCNSERRRFRLTKSHNDAREFVGGHEAVGSVEEKSYLKKTYALLPHSNCLTRMDKKKCGACASGNENLCTKMKHAGLDNGTPSGFAEKMWVPRNQLFDVSECDQELAPFLEPLACVVRAWKKTKDRVHRMGISVGIVGGGPIGCLHAMYANRLNKDNKIYILESCKKRRLTLLEIFKNFSNIKVVNNTAKIECDMSIMAASNTGAYSATVGITKADGIVILFSGFDELNFQDSTFLPEIIHRNEFMHYANNHSFIGSSGYTANDIILSKKMLIDFDELKKLVTGKVYGLDSKIIKKTNGTSETFDEPVIFRDLKGHLSHHIKIQYYNSA